MLSFRSITFLAYVGLAFSIPYLPIINWPFTWWASYFHELSKALSILHKPIYNKKQVSQKFRKILE